MIEPPSLFAELMTRFPDQIGIRPTPGLGLVVEGRPYPYYEGPGPAARPQNGMTEAPGVDPRSPAGVVANADTDGIDAMVLFPSFGLCVPTIEDPALGSAVARIYNTWAADFCARSGGRLLRRRRGAHRARSTTPSPS